MATVSAMRWWRILVVAAVGLAMVPPSAAEARPTCAGLAATIVGTQGHDKILGTPRRDVIAALSGWDTVRGRGGDDVICGSDGADTLVGGRGDDRLYGGRGAVVDDRSGPHLLNDELRGGPGNDRLVGGRDNRDLPAPLPDSVDFSAAVRGMEVDLGRGIAVGQGQDTLSVQAWYVIGSRYDDRLIGSRFGDQLTGRLGTDRLEGRAGPDVLGGDVIGGPVETTPDVLLGEQGDDYLSTGDGPDVQHGGAGDDQLSDWGTNADRLYGGAGDDWVSDTVVPAEGQVLRGGTGRNRLSLSTKFVADSDRQQVAGVTDLRSGLTRLQWSPPTVVETSGFTTLTLPDAPWTIYGTDAAEYFWESNTGARTIYAGGGDDHLGGSNLADHLDGGPGNDEAVPQRGRDTCVNVEEILYGDTCEATG
jgi:Ca2+-binding RTX toxin-like protein